MDFDYLEGFLAGDKAVVKQVLALFVESASAWRAGLDAGNPGWRDVAHTIKGAAKGIGAGTLADFCTRAEAGDPAALAEAGAALAVLGPEATLERGYGIVRRTADDAIVRDPAEVPGGSRLRIRVARGEFPATADDT